MISLSMMLLSEIPVTRLGLLGSFLAMCTQLWVLWMIVRWARRTYREQHGGHSQ